MYFSNVVECSDGRDCLMEVSHDLMAGARCDVGELVLRGWVLR